MRNLIGRICLCCIFAAAVVTGLESCATAKDISNSTLVKGEMNYFSADGCWILESGTMQDKKFYQLTGDESDLREVQISEAQVTVRLIPHPDQKPTCRLAGLVAELVEVVEVQKR